MAAYNLTAAVIGTGYIGKQHIEALKSIVSDIVLCNTDEESGKMASAKYGLRFYNDLDQLLDNERIDFACICVPTSVHCKIAHKLLDRGVNVLCEKPFATSCDDAYEVVKSAQEKNLKLMVAHCVRFSKQYEFLKRCIEDGRYGKLISLNLHRNGPAPAWSKDNWLLGNSSGGVLLDVHIHDTDVLNFMLGVPKTVYTKGSFSCNTTLYGYDDGLLISASASWRNASSYPFMPGFEAAFEHGVLKLYDNVLYLYTNDGICKEPEKSEQYPDYLKSDNLIENEITYFCNCLETGVLPERCLPEDSLKSLEIVFSEFNSVASGKEIQLNLQ